MKLTTRFLLILLGIAVLPLLLSVGWNIYQYNSSVASYYELHKGLSQLSAVNVDEWFLTTNRSLAFLYEIENPLQAKKLDEAKVIQQAARINSDIMSLSLLSQEGKEVFFVQSDKVREKKSLASYAVELASRAHDSGIVTASSEKTTIDLRCLP